MEKKHNLAYPGGVRGTQADFAEYAKPMSHDRFVMTDDPGYKWLETAVGELLAPEAGSSGQTLTLFDLRMLRFRGIDLSPKWERVVYGYDLFVLIPELTPGSPME